MELDDKIKQAIAQHGRTSNFLLPIEGDGRVLDMNKLEKEFPHFWRHLFGEDGDPDWEAAFENALGKIRASHATIKQLEGQREVQHRKAFGTGKSNPRQIAKYRSMGDEIWNLEQQHKNVVDAARDVLGAGWRAARVRLHEEIRDHVTREHESAIEADEAFARERDRIEEAYRASRDKHVAAHEQWMENFSEQCREDRKHAEEQAKQLGESFRETEQSIADRIAELEDKIVAVKRAAEEDESRTLLTALEAANRLR